jgi:hypothetical protein
MLTHAILVDIETAIRPYGAARVVLAAPTCRRYRLSRNPSTIACFQHAG